MFKPRDQPGWHKASEWLLASTIAVHGFGNDFYSAHSKVTEEDIEEVFRLYGKILHTQIWKSQRGGAWAFVTFTCKEDRDAAICQLDGQTIDVWTRAGHKQIQWQTPLKVTAPRFHSVRFYYNQYAAARIVPPELAFTPSAAPGQGGTFQRALVRSSRSSFRPQPDPRYGRRPLNNLSIDTSFQNNHDRPSSPTPSMAEMSIQWGQERVQTPEPASPAYDSEQTFCSSGENISPGEDDGEEMEDYDYGCGEQDESQQAMSSLHQRSAVSRDTPSPPPSSHYDDHDDSSVYPQSPRSTSEPSSQGRKRRRLDDDFEDDDDPDYLVRRLQAENERLRRERDEARDEADVLREREIRFHEVEAERAVYTRRLERFSDMLCSAFEHNREQDRRPRPFAAAPPYEPRLAEEPSASAPHTVTTTIANVVSALQSKEGATLLANMLQQMATANSGEA